RRAGPPPTSPLLPYTTLFRSPHSAGNSGTVALQLRDARTKAEVRVHLLERGRVTERRELSRESRVQGDVVGDVPVRENQGVSLRSEEHTSELQSRENLVCRLL